jgi:steroid 5-alpha reductase family enzyme
MARLGLLLALLALAPSNGFANSAIQSPKKPRPALLGAVQRPLPSSRTGALSMMGPVARSAAIFGAANGVGFGISVATGWHYHLDLIGTGIFAVAAVAVAGSAPVQRLSAAAVALWASKLAGFLFYRALQTKYDLRLTDVLATPSGAFGFWLISYAWGWFVSLPHTLAAGVPAASAPGVRTGCSLVGLGMFGVGLLIETLADLQKWSFKQLAANKGAFCDVGVWRLCQHPNWFGNLLLWTGITLLNAPSLLAPSPTSGGRLRRALRLCAAALSPLFMVALFSGQASGLPSLHVSPVPAPTVLRRPLRFSSRPTAPSATASSWRPSATVPTLATRRVPRKPPLPCPLHTAPSLLRLSPLGPSHGPGLPRCDAAALPDVGQPESSLVGR